MRKCHRSKYFLTSAASVLAGTICIVQLILGSTVAQAQEDPMPGVGEIVLAQTRETSIKVSNALFLTEVKAVKAAGVASSVGQHKNSETCFAPDSSLDERKVGCSAVIESRYREWTHLGYSLLQPGSCTHRRTRSMIGQLKISIKRWVSIPAMPVHTTIAV